MILTDIQAYLAKHQKASLADLSTHFRMSEAALTPMLERLVKKGRIRLVSLEKCGGCSRCSSESMAFYEWVNPQ
jgi:putative ferrous iron transport protein C